MIPLSCPVRDCFEPLTRIDAALRCPRGHSFDLARDGYWNLLQPQDRKSPLAGDNKEAVEARRRWLERGFVAGFAQVVRAVVDGVVGDRAARILDAGCGEGTMTAATVAGPEREVCGIDLSVTAIRLAARRLPEATWVVANADRRIPLADGCLDVVISLFGRRNVGEFGRVLRPGGHCVVAVPGAEDLAELREAVQGSAQARDRVPVVIDEMSGAFGMVDRRAWRERRERDRGAIDDALAMSYRGARRAERERTAELDRLDVTLSADILVFERA